MLFLRQEIRDERRAEASFNRPSDIAKRQHAKSWQLRAAVSLGRLWRDQGKRLEARQLLSEVVNWFIEGFGTLDLREARETLAQLA